MERPAEEPAPDRPPAARRVRILAFAVSLSLGWTATVAASLWLNLAVEHDHTLAVATEVARAAAQKDLAYRFWAARQGGVYVPVTEHTPPNPYLAHLPRRDVTTSDGHKLTLVNPAYMTRQVQELARDVFGAAGHITSLNPLRPENRPDAWEAEALRRAAGGQSEVVEVREEEGGATLRYLRALRTERSCLGCHGVQGYREGDLRGGLGVQVDMEPFLSAERRQVRSLAWGHGAVWLMGAVVIALGAGRLRWQLRDRERQERERLRLEQQLFRARKLEALGRLSGGVAHDFNNLLTPILGNAEAALADLPAGSPLREDLEEIRSAAGRARDLVRRLLAFGRQQPERPEPVDLGETAAGMQRMLQRLLGEDVEVRLEPAAGAPRALADRAQVELALVNLAINARDAMPGGGRLTVRTGAEELAAPAAAALGVEPGAFAVLEVADSGTGMDEETRAHLFEPFFSTKAQGRGTGLGLATVHAAVRRSGGAIEVRSEPGQGSTFRLLLPATSAPVRAAPPPAPAPRGREAVWVVEDDDQVRRYLAMSLTALGYAVRVLEGPEAALELAARGERADLLVSDVAMPGMQGPELWRRLEPLLPGARVLFVSAHAESELSGRGEGPIAPLLGKPFTAPELGRAVRDALDAGAASRVGA